MTTMISGSQLRTMLFGTAVSKSTGTLAATTVSLFTVAGGKVLVTSLVGEVTTAITVANSYKLQHNPTVGATADLCAATDIGTADTPLGSLLGFQGLTGDSIVQGPGAVPSLKQPIVLTAGVVESVSLGTDGVILWKLTYVPLDDGASIVAA